MFLIKIRGAEYDTRRATMYKIGAVFVTAYLPVIIVGGRYSFVKGFLNYMLCGHGNCLDLFIFYKIFC